MRSRKSYGGLTLAASIVGVLGLSGSAFDIYTLSNVTPSGREYNQPTRAG
jgi:hypothetical protein